MTASTSNSNNWFDLKGDELLKIPVRLSSSKRAFILLRDLASKTAFLCTSDKLPLEFRCELD